MSGRAPAYRMAVPCYGMSGCVAATSGAPQIRCARRQAARMRAKGNGTMLKSRFTSVVAAVLIAAALPAVAEGKVPLAEEGHINEQLVAAAAGDILRQTCPSISARMLVVLVKMQQLESYARSEGYTRDEVTLFLKNKAEKARVKAAAKEYLAAAGAVEGDVESYCAAGRAEISQGTLVGSLLRSSQ